MMANRKTEVWNLPVLFHERRKVGVETHLVMSKAAEMTLAYETDYKAKDVRELATVTHPIGDIGASISSGSSSASPYSASSRSYSSRNASRVARSSSVRSTVVPTIWRRPWS